MGKKGHKLFNYRKFSLSISAFGTAFRVGGSNAKADEVAKWTTDSTRQFSHQMLAKKAPRCSDLNWKKAVNATSSWRPATITRYKRVANNTAWMRKTRTEQGVEVTRTAQTKENVEGKITGEIIKSTLVRKTQYCFPDRRSAKRIIHKSPRSRIHMYKS